MCTFFLSLHYQLDAGLSVEYRFVSILDHTNFGCTFRRAPALDFRSRNLDSSEATVCPWYAIPGTVIIIKITIIIRLLRKGIFNLGESRIGGVGQNGTPGPRWTTLYQFLGASIPEFHLENEDTGPFCQPQFSAQVSPSPCRRRLHTCPVYTRRGLYTRIAEHFSPGSRFCQLIGTIPRESLRTSSSIFPRRCLFSFPRIDPTPVLAPVPPPRTSPYSYLPILR